MSGYDLAYNTAPVMTQEEMIAQLMAPRPTEEALKRYKEELQQIIEHGLKEQNVTYELIPCADGTESLVQVPVRGDNVSVQESTASVETQDRRRRLYDDDSDFHRDPYMQSAWTMPIPEDPPERKRQPSTKTERRERARKREEPKLKKFKFVRSSQITRTGFL